MAIANANDWSDRMRLALGSYTEGLLRRVAARLIRPRSQWPAEELIDRCVAVADNAAVIDRRLEELGAPGRHLLAFMAHSGRPSWPIGRLLDLLAAVGHSEGLQPVLELLGRGLLYPAPPAEAGSGENGRIRPRLAGFEQWLGRGNAADLRVFAHPAVLARALKLNVGLPECPRAPGPVPDARPTG